LSMTLMATLSPVSLFLAIFTLAKVPSPRVFPSSYFPTRVRGLLVSSMADLKSTAPVEWNGSFFFLSAFRCVAPPPFSVLPYFHLPEDCARLMSSLFLSASISQPCYSISQLVSSCCCYYILYYGNTSDHTALKKIRLLFPCSSTTDERHQEKVQGSLSRFSMTRRKKTKTKKEEDETKKSKPLPASSRRIPLMLSK
jgi:hypothetical protein